jgi:hypothetical protein
MSMHDDELRTRFRELRTHVEGTVPPFHVDRAEPSPAKTTWTVAGSILRQAAIVTLIALGAASVLWVRGHFGARRADTRYVEADMMKWTAPTDVLLQTPGRELTASVPVLSASVVQPQVFTNTH